MNYSRANVKNYNSPKLRKQHAAQQRFIHSLVKTLLILILLIMAAAAIGFASYAKTQIDKLPDISQVNISP